MTWLGKKKFFKPRVCYNYVVTFQCAIDLFHLVCSPGVLVHLSGLNYQVLICPRLAKPQRTLGVVTHNIVAEYHTVSTAAIIYTQMVAF